MKIIDFKIGKTLTGVRAMREDGRVSTITLSTVFDQLILHNQDYIDYRHDFVSKYIINPKGFTRCVAMSYTEFIEQTCEKVLLNALQDIFEQKEHTWTALKAVA